MDYIEIILRGYSNENDREFLDEYFICEFRKVEKNYSIQKFFTGLATAIDTLKKEYNIALYKRRIELDNMLEREEKGTKEYEIFKNQLSLISFEDFPINLSRFTNNRFYWHLYYSQVEFIGNEISKAYRVLSQPQQVEVEKNDEVYKTQNLFKVGLLFATGKMNKYFTINSLGYLAIKEGYSAPKIAKELGGDIHHKYISASINNYTDRVNGNKNIFNSLDMMSKVIEHCKTNKLDIQPYFESRLPIE